MLADDRSNRFIIRNTGIILNTLAPYPFSKRRLNQ